MGKSKRRKHNAHKETKQTVPQRQQSEQEHLRHTISKSWKIVLRVITLLAISLGFVTGYHSLVPRISVWQNQPLNPIDPFSAPFIVSNDGPLGINDINFTCNLLSVVTVNKNRFINVQLFSEGLTVMGMEPGERTTVPCIFRGVIGLSESDTIEKADVVMIVEFRPDFVPHFRQTRRYRFLTLRALDGKLYWYPQAYSRITNNN